MPVEVSVSYQLVEYLSMISEFEPQSAVHREAMRKAKSIRWAKILPSAKWFERAFVIVLGTPIFLVKRALVGTCVFRVDHKQIERTSKSGALAKPWSSVALVHRLSAAYLVELEHGAMPMPYRCFSLEQRYAFESLVPEGKLGAARHVA